VEVVSIMLGTNDSKVAENISVDDYKTNLETIITQLKTADIKKIILNEPPYIVSTGQWDTTSLSKMIGYIAAIDELVDGETVLSGDSQAYAYFEANQTELPDNIHPNVSGHEHLGTFRATAIKSALVYQTNPAHHFLN
jgi:lysophospholipase L1-like esterase